MKISIKCRFSNKVLFEGEYESTRHAVEAAVKKGANLASANLEGANLSRANLKGAYLAGVNLEGANLSRANLASANLASANLSRANLKGAYLAGVNLEGANLEGANLEGANLSNPPISFGCVGKERRTGFAIMENGVVIVRLGCFKGTEEEAVIAIKKKYGADSTYEGMVKAACAQVRWYAEEATGKGE